MIDVRVLPEFDTPSSPSEYKLNIARVTSYLELGEKVVVCCSHGMNRIWQTDDHKPSGNL
jgi:protein-tyrosine phosphatase